MPAAPGSAPAAPGSPSAAGAPPRRASFRTGQQPITGAQAEGGGASTGIATTTGAAKTSTSAGGPRRARVMLAAVDPLSVMKLSFLLAIAAGIMMVVAVSVLWGVLNQMGVFVDLQNQITTLFSTDAETDILQFLDYNKVVSAAAVLAVFNTVIITALGAIFALLYNIVVKMVGGVYLTLSDD